MTGDCHVRFCESLGLQRPGPLTKKKGKRQSCVKQARKKYGAVKKGKGKKK